MQSKELDPNEMILLAEEIVKENLPERKEETRILADTLQSDFLNDFTFPQPSDPKIRTDHGDIFLKTYRSWKSNIKSTYGPHVSEKISLDSLYRIANEIRGNFKDAVEDLNSDPRVDSQTVDQAMEDLKRWIQIETTVHSAKSLDEHPTKRIVPIQRDTPITQDMLPKETVDTLLSELKLSVIEVGEGENQLLKKNIARFVDNFFLESESERDIDHLAADFMKNLDKWRQNAGFEDFWKIAKFAVDYAFDQQKTNASRANKAIEKGLAYDQSMYQVKARKWARRLRIIQQAVYG